jgi:hypothetical protein
MNDPAAKPDYDATKSKELPLSFAQCPNCGCEFEDIRIISLPQFASNMMVSLGTVRWWMQTGKLKFRLWARFGKIHRVILSLDGRRFIQEHLGDPEKPNESYTIRLWHKSKANGQKGWYTRKRNEELRKEGLEPEPSIKEVSPVAPEPQELLSRP